MGGWEDGVVDGDVGGTEFGGECSGAGDVSREDRRGEVLVAAAVEAEGVGESGDEDDCERGSEVAAFDEGRGHWAVDDGGGADGGAVAQRGRIGACGVLATVGDGGGDELLEGVRRGVVDEAADGGFGREGAEGGDEVGVGGLMNEGAAWSHAGLAVVDGDGGPDGAGGLGRVGVFEDEGGVAPGEFEGAGREGWGEGLRDLAADGRRAGEENVVQTARTRGVLGEEFGASLARGLGPVEDARWREASFDGELEETELCLGGLFAGLDDDAVARGEGLDHLDAQELDGIVPSGDDGDGAEGSALFDDACAGEPPGCGPDAARGEECGGALFEPAARREEGEEVAHHGLEARASDFGLGEGGEFSFVAGEEAAELLNPEEAVAQRGPGGDWGERERGGFGGGGEHKEGYGEEGTGDWKAIRAIAWSEFDPWLAVIVWCAPRAACRAAGDEGEIECLRGVFRGCRRFAPLAPPHAEYER